MGVHSQRDFVGQYLKHSLWPEVLGVRSVRAAKGLTHMCHRVICQRQWMLHSMDIKICLPTGGWCYQATFTSGLPLRLKVKGMEAQKMCLWSGRCLPVLVQQSNGSNVGNRRKMSQLDPAVFYWLDKECAITGVFACHVYDFIWGAHRVSLQ